MRGRRRSITAACHTDGCKETTFFEYYNSTEGLSAATRAESWKCLRHKNTIAVLRPDNPRRVYEAIVMAEPYGPFWSDNGRPNNGLLAGPGFYAFAADFPEGTRLRVTAEIIPDTKCTPDCIMWKDPVYPARQCAICDAPGAK